MTHDERVNPRMSQQTYDFKDCRTVYQTMGLLGTFNNMKEDDLMTPDCNAQRISQPASENDYQNLYELVIFFLLQTDKTNSTFCTLR